METPLPNPSPNQNSENDDDYETTVKNLPFANPIQKKRLINEKKLLEKAHLHFCTAYPEPNNPLIWNFMIYGQKGTPYEGGEYIGKIVHSPRYPMAPPDYYMLTPNGRFEINRKICLTNSSFHKETWSSTWTIENLLIGVNIIWLNDKESGLGHLHESSADRRLKAQQSVEYNRRNHREIYEKFDRRDLLDHDPVPNNDQKESGEGTNTNANASMSNNTDTNVSNSTPTLIDNLSNIGNIIFGKGTDGSNPTDGTNDEIKVQPDEQIVQVRKKRIKKVQNDT